jgi:hypothetical protein
MNRGFFDFLFFGSVGDLILVLEDVEIFLLFWFLLFIISLSLSRSFIELELAVNEFLPFLLIR